MTDIQYMNSKIIVIKNEHKKYFWFYSSKINKMQGLHLSIFEYMLWARGELLSILEFIERRVCLENLITTGIWDRKLFLHYDSN